MRSDNAGNGRRAATQSGQGLALKRAGFVTVAAAVAALIGGAAIVLSEQGETVEEVADDGTAMAVQPSEEAAPADSDQEVSPATTSPGPAPICGATLPAGLLLFNGEDPALVERAEHVDEQGRLVHTASFQDMEITVAWPMVERADAVQARPAWDRLGSISSIVGLRTVDGQVEPKRSFLTWNSDRHDVLNPAVSRGHGGDI